jgi:hypothetical protein
MSIHTIVARKYVILKLYIVMTSIFFIGIGAIAGMTSTHSLVCNHDYDFMTVCCFFLILGPIMDSSTNGFV